jgi:hypothetical protein
LLKSISDYERYLNYGGAMMKNNINMLLIVSIVLMAVISGCVGGKDVTSAFKALSEVQQFMAEHPNAKTGSLL